MERKDEDLIMDYQGGNQDAAGILFQRYNRPIFNFAFRMMTNRADAEDVTADVFLVLFSRRYAYDPDAKFSTWLYTVARNKCIDQIRKRKRFAAMWFKKSDEDGFEVWDVPDEREISREELENREMAARVKIAIKDLPENMREALILREYQDLTYIQISQILDCSLENVKILIFRAREQLKQELSSFIKEDE